MRKSLVWWIRTWYMQARLSKSQFTFPSKAWRRFSKISRAKPSRLVFALANCYESDRSAPASAALCRSGGQIILNRGCSAGIDIKIMSFDDIEGNAYPEVQHLHTAARTEWDGNSVIFTSGSKFAHYLPSQSGCGAYCLA